MREGGNMICITCGNEIYFETDVETMQALATDSQSFIIDEAVFEDFNHGEEMLRSGLMDNVYVTLKLHADDLNKDYNSQRYFNPYLSCAVCHGREVIFPSSTWTKINKNLPLHEEILSNHHEYRTLRKEQQNANKLPVLWQP